MENKMLKRMMFVLILLILCADLYGQRRGERGKGIVEKTYNPDEDYDFKVDSVELRKWVESISTVYSYSRDFIRTNEAVQLLRDFDKDNDRKLSTKETLEFRSYIKPIFEKASNKLLLENDSNKNRRLDKSELEIMRGKISNFLNFALKNDKAEKEQAAKKAAAEKEAKPIRALTDIYD